MNHVERLQAFFVYCATVGPVGAMPFGFLIASLLGWPLVLFFRLIKYVNHDLYLLSFMAAVILFCSIFETALLTLPAYEYHRVILSSALGLMCAFAYEPFHFSWMFFGYCLFHGVRIATGIVLQQWAKIEFHTLPGILSFLTRDLLAGIATQILLLFVHVIA